MCLTAVVFSEYYMLRKKYTMEINLGSLFRRKLETLPPLPENDLRHSLKKSPETGESFDFKTWKQKLEGAEFYQQFLETLQSIPNFSDSEIQEYFFGEGGLIERFSNGEMEHLPEDEYDMGQFSNGGDDHFSFEEWFYRIVGFKMLDEIKMNNESIPDESLVLFLEKLKQIYQKNLERWRRSAQEYISKDSQNSEALSLYEEESEASLGETGWKSSETPLDAYDSHRQWDREDFERDKSLDLAHDFFSLCANKKFVKALPALVEIVTYAPNGSLNQKGVETFNAIDPHRTAEILLEKIRGNTVSKREKNVAGRLLYLLEMGEVAVTYGQLEYLSKKYNLVGYKKDEAVTAIRITPDGKLGLLDANKKLIGYIEFGDFAGEDEREAQIMEISAELVLAKQNISAFERKKSDKKIEKYLEEYHTIFFEGLIVQETGVHINNISQREQFWFYQFLKQNEGTEKKEEVLKYAREFGESFVQAFVIAEFEKEAGDKILYVAEHLSKEDAKELFEAFSSVALEAQYEVKKIKEECGEDIGLSDGAILEALLVRAKDSLFSVSRRLEHGENSKEVVRTTTNNLRRETSREKIVSGRFRLLAEVFRSHEEEIDVSTMVDAQDRVDGALFLRALHERGELKPIPEIHWRVDRGQEEYQRRFGFDINKLLMRLAGDEKKVLLEFGPGSGKSKSQRQESGIGEYYTDIALADTVYYPLGEFIAASIDWGKLQAALPEGMKLNEEQKQLLSDALYKIIMIADGQTEKDNFAYAKDRIEKLSRDPALLAEILQSVSSQLPDIKAVPSTISTRDAEGNVTYPYKLDLTAPEMLVAKATLADNILNFLKEGDPYEHIPAHPAGMMVGDFGEIKKLKDNQIDVAFGVRSTVYKRGEEYIDFMLTLMDKLKSGGVYVDDNIRDNDGWYYRLGEMTNVVRQLEEKNRAGLIDYDLTLQLVVGPGFLGEDFSQGEVPLALVIGKNADHSSVVQELLESEKGFRLVPFHEYIQNTSAIRALDETGYTLEVLEAELESPAPEVGVALAA